MSARDTILNAVRGGLGNTAVDPAAVRREADALLLDLAAIRPQIASDSLFMANQIRKLDQIRRVGDHPALQPPPKVPTCGMADLATTGTLASIASGYLFEDSQVKGARRAAPRFAG